MIRIFISYSHSDKEYKNELEKHLSVLKRNREINTWTDKMIVPGELWDDSIRQALSGAEMIILLISPDFLASDFCYDIEMTKALERHEKGEAIVIPIIARYCNWKNTPFAKIQALPSDSKPIKSWDDQDEAFYDVVSGLESSIKLFAPKGPTNASNTTNGISPNHENVGKSGNDGFHKKQEETNSEQVVSVDFNKNRINSFLIIGVSLLFLGCLIVSANDTTTDSGIGPFLFFVLLPFILIFKKNKLLSILNLVSGGLLAIVGFIGMIATYGDKKWYEQIFASCLFLSGLYIISGALSCLYMKNTLSRKKQYSNFVRAVVIIAIIYTLASIGDT